MIPRPGEYLLAVATPPATDPVTVTESKLDLRITSTAHDTRLEGLIADATVSAEEVVGKAFITQTLTYSLRSVGGDNRIWLPKTPAQSITSITYYDSDNVQQTLDKTNYHFHASEDWAYLEPKNGYTWPAVYHRLDAITITYVAGFGLAAAVPLNIRRAIRVTVAQWFEDPLGGDLPLAALSLLAMSRTGWVA